MQTWAVVFHTYSNHSADCNRNYSLVAIKVRLMPKKPHHCKTRGWPCINTCCTANSDGVQQSADTFREAVENSTFNIDTVESNWSHLHDTIYNSAIATFGKREFKKHWLVWGAWGRNGTSGWGQEESPTGLQEDLQLQHMWCPQSCQDQGATDHSSLSNAYWLNLCSKKPKMLQTPEMLRGCTMVSRRQQACQPPGLSPPKDQNREVIMEQSRQLEHWGGALPSIVCNPECGVWCCHGGPPQSLCHGRTRSNGDCGRTQQSHQLPH